MQGLLLLQEKFVLAKFAITILPECYYQKHFLSLHCPKGQDILDESVSLLALYRNLENFKQTRVSNNIHHLYWYAICLSILYKCGVLFILFAGIPEPRYR